jgi:uncharacterized membrane protein
MTSHHPASLRRIIEARYRLFVSVALGISIAFALPTSMRLTTRLVLGWDILTLLYIAMTGHLIIKSNVENCRRRAALYDEGDWIILLATLFGAVASFGAIIAELAASKAAGAPVIVTFTLTAITVALSWAFTHLIFALHYANLYYRADAKGSHGGLIFPGGREPDYRDFLYYSFVIACAAQTADVSTVTSDMRRVTLIHCITAFAFNSAILALMINITAGLMG